jgi:hypothetical protein
MEPTDEQRDALEKFMTGESLIIEACAGAGKTTTLKMLARATTRRGLYIAFNSEIAREARASFPPGVDCRTGHSLAYKALGYAFRRAGRLRSRVTARVMLDELGELPGMGAHDPYALYVRVLRAVSKFCESARARPGLADFGELDPERELDAVLMGRGADWLTQVWEQMSRRDGDVPMTHDVYLKAWALTRPVCPADYVLFDEAQDANAVLLDLLRLWRERDGAQIVAVGDRYQQIYSWRGAVNAMSRFEATHHARLTQSWRYGEPIAALARTLLSTLRGVDVPIRGTASPARVVTTPGQVREEDALPDAILTRTNAIALAELIGLHERGVSVAVAGGVGDMIGLLRGVEALMDGRTSRRAELAGFTSWSEVVEASEQEDGADLRVLVRMVEDYDLSYLLTQLEAIERVEDARVTISTAHRSKGLEWEHVRLAGDFRVPEPGEDDGVVRVEHEEAHLLYVAATRARSTLDVSACPLALYALELAGGIEDGDDEGAPLAPREPEELGGCAQEEQQQQPGAREPVGSRRVSLLARLDALARERGVDPDDLLEAMLGREVVGAIDPVQGRLFS